jgi:hypothetical protein
VALGAAEASQKLAHQRPFSTKKGTSQNKEGDEKFGLISAGFLPGST